MPSDQNSPDGHQPGYQRRQWSRSEIFSAISTLATFAGSAFAAGALIAALLAVNEARRQADTAQQTLIAVDRPWIKVIGLSNVRFKVDKFGVRLATMIDVKNTGRSPAPQTWIATNLITHRDVIDEGIEADLLCREMYEHRFDLNQILVFPDEEHRFFDVSIAPMRDIMSFKEKEALRDFEIRKREFGQKKAEEFQRNFAPQKGFSGFTLIGCASYIIPSGRSFGQTSFVYHIYRNCDNKQCAFSITTPALFEEDEVITRASMRGHFAR